MGIEDSIRDLIKKQDEEIRLTDKRVRQLYMLFSPEDWIAPSLLNSWVNWASGTQAGYFKDAFGIVHLRGLVKDGTIGQAIFQLPVGYRPAAYVEVHAVSSHDGANELSGRCDIELGGNVIAQTGGNYYFSLDGITFRIA